MSGALPLWEELFPSQVVSGEWLSKWHYIFWVTSMLTWQTLVHRRTCVKTIIWVGWTLTIFDGNFTQTSLQFNLIMPGQRAFSDSQSAQITEMHCWLIVPTTYAFSKLLRCVLAVDRVFLWTAGKFHSHADSSNEHKILLPERGCQ